MIVNDEVTIQDMDCYNDGVHSIMHKTDQTEQYPVKNTSWYEKMTFKNGRWIEVDWRFGLVDTFTYTSGSIIMKSDPENFSSDPFEKWALISVNRNYTKVVHLRCYNT